MAKKRENKLRKKKTKKKTNEFYRDVKRKILFGTSKTNR